MLGFLKKKTEQALSRSREGWVGKVSDLFNRPTLDEELWDELEELLITADVGADTADKFLTRLKDRVKKEKVTEGGQAYALLKEEIVNTVQVGKSCQTASKDSVSPWVILVVGVNGSGKTTTIAKLAHDFKEDGKQVMLAAGDTFRAAASEQLETWGERIGAQVISHQAGADPGAVAFDAMEAAKSRGAKVLIIDTAGRLHTKFNLMEELKKIKRVTQKVDPESGG